MSRIEYIETEPEQIHRIFKNYEIYFKFYVTQAKKKLGRKWIYKTQKLNKNGAVRKQYQRIETQKAIFSTKSYIAKKLKKEKSLKAKLNREVKKILKEKGYIYKRIIGIKHI